MPVPNPFDANAFSMIEMTSAINSLEHVPRRLDQLGLFAEDGTTDRLLSLERHLGLVELVSAREPGASGQIVTSDPREIVDIRIPHLPTTFTIRASEVAGVRAFGTSDQHETVERERDRKLAKARSSLEATREFHRVGALKGQILDADGATVLLNIYDKLGVTKPGSVDFKLSSTDPKLGALRKLISDVIRSVEDALGDIPYTGIHAFCGSAFFDKLVDHPETREAYQRWQDGQALRDRTARRDFFYAGVTFEEYRGRVAGQPFIAGDAVHFFPVGADGIFETWNAPAETFPSVNTRGLPFYVNREVDPREEPTWMRGHVESNPISFCKLPEVLHEGAGN